MGYRLLLSDTRGVPVGVKLGIAWKLTITFLVITLLAVGLSGYLFFDLSRQQLLDERRVAVLTQVNMVAVSLASALDLPEDLNPTTLVPVLRQHSRQTGSRLLLMDTSRRIVADSNQGEAGPNLVGRIMLEPWLNDVVAGRQQVVIRLLDSGVWAMYAAVPIVTGEQVRGILLLSQSIDDIAAALRELTRQLLLIIAASGLLVVLLSFLVGQRLTIPLRRLTVAAEEMARGNLKQKIEISGSDELANLGQTFNMMASRLQAVDETRRQFIGDASHEMRTPLAIIKTVTENLHTILDDKTGQEYLAIIDRQVQRLSDLVSRLLLLTRLDHLQAAGTMNRRPVNLSALIRRVMDSLAPTARSQGVILEMDAPEEPVWLEADEEGLYTVFANLLENGIRYSDRGGVVTVRIKTAEGAGVTNTPSSAGRDGESDWCEIQVSDTGIGIPEQDKERIFRRFYRGDPARSRQSGGFGLGLAIVQQIVKLHGGTVSVDSCPGVGSTFIVRLPRTDTTWPGVVEM